MRGVIAHAALLAVALVLAWSTWSRDEGADTEEARVLVWDGDPERVDSVVYATDERRVVVRRRNEDGEPYLWGTEVRRPPAPVADSAGAAAPAPPPDTSAFPVGLAGEELVRRLAPLRAVRDLGAPEADSLDAYGLAEPTDTLVVSMAGEDRERLLLGSPVFGGTHRYALEPRTGRVYAISGDVVLALQGGRARLQEQRLHAFEMSEVHRVVLTTPGSERVRLRSGGTGGVPTTWSPPDEPERPDATFANFMARLTTLRSLDFRPTLSVDSTEFLARLDYLDEEGDRLGTLELYRDGAGESVIYYLRTELTRVPARAAPSVAERLAEDLEQLFGGGEGGSAGSGGEDGGGAALRGSPPTRAPRRLQAPPPGPA